MLQYALLCSNHDSIPDVINLRSHFNIIDFVQQEIESLPPNTPASQLRRHTQDMQFSVQHIRKSIEYLLAIQIEDRTLQHSPFSPVSVSIFSLRALLEKIVDIDRRSTYFKPNHALYLELVDDVPDAFPCDEDKLEQILHNLIGNALKFSPEGGTVTLRVQRESSNTILFSIHDQGIGMSREFLPLFGEKFSRPPESETRGLKGAGIGAFLCQMFVKLMAGQLWAHSDGLGKGSTVFVRLPYDPLLDDTQLRDNITQLRHWRIKLSALLAELDAFPTKHYRFDARTHADFAQLVHTELEQMQAFLVQLEKDHAADHD
ncbi:MAG: ATP-binding protein [Armatimonadetes bacterium]|nr:ATP-binding protein [Armatimonadota bacterium]